MSINNENKVQYDDCFRRSKWMFDSLDNVKINSLIELFDQYNYIFHRIRNELLTERISAIVKTLEDNGVNFGNIVIINCKRVFTLSVNFKFCSNCDKDAPASQRTRRSCKSKLVQREPAIENLNHCEKDINPYSHFTTKPQVSSIRVVVGEPDMLNPNSFENLSTILQTLGKCAIIEKYSQMAALKNENGYF